MDTTTLLTTEQHGDVVATVLDNNPDTGQPLAARIVNEALKYIATCVQFPHARIAPSRTVDEGWHALILHTALYANLCTQFGMFVHHYPERPDPDRWDAQTSTEPPRSSRRPGTASTTTCGPHRTASWCPWQPHASTPTTAGRS